MLGGRESDLQFINIYSMLLYDSLKRPTPSVETNRPQDSGFRVFLKNRIFQVIDERNVQVNEFLKISNKIK